MAEAAKLQEAMALGAQKAQLARAPESGGDAGQSGIVTAAQADAEGEIGRGGANDATRPDDEIEAGRGDADGVAQPVAGEETSGGTQELPAGQRGVEGVKEEESVPRAPAMEETCIPEPARAGDEGTVAAATAQMASQNVVPVL